MEKVALSIAPAVGVRDKRLSHAERNLLSILGIYANRTTGWCWPSNTTLANDLGTTPRRIRDYLRRLVELGYIERQEKAGKSSGTKIIHKSGQQSLYFDEPTPARSEPTPRPVTGLPPRPVTGLQNVPMNYSLNYPREDSELNPDSESKKPAQSSKGNSGDLVIAVAAQKPEIDFDYFWKCWRLKGAKRGSKQRSLELYTKHIKQGIISHKELCVHVERLQRFYELNGTPTSKQLHPPTWLHQRRWQDELVIDEPERKNGNGRLKSTSELAQNIADRLGMVGGRTPPPNGRGSGVQPDSDEPTGFGGRGNGGSDIEVPTWLDPEGDPGFES